jgi:hypothetical protein
MDPPPIHFNRIVYKCDVIPYPICMSNEPFDPDSPWHHLFKTNDYAGIIEHASTKDCNDDTESLYLGIAYYKTSQWHLANTIFDDLYARNPHPEIAVYRIISRIKYGDIDEAMQAYQLLCDQQNPIIHNYLINQNTQAALEHILLLAAIPLNLSPPHTQPTGLLDMLHAYQYNKLAQKLLATQPHQ